MHCPTARVIRQITVHLFVVMCECVGGCVSVQQRLANHFRLYFTIPNSINLYYYFVASLFLAFIRFFLFFCSLCFVSIVFVFCHEKVLLPCCLAAVMLRIYQLLLFHLNINCICAFNRSGVQQLSGSAARQRRRRECKRRRRRTSA